MVIALLQFVGRGWNAGIASAAVWAVLNARELLVRVDSGNSLREREVVSAGRACKGREMNLPSAKDFGHGEGGIRWGMF